MNFPTPNTVLGKAIERAFLVALIAGLGVLINDPQFSQGGLAYFCLKTVLDFLNRNVPTK